MFSVQTTETTMKLLPVVCLSVLTWSETASADENVVVEEGRDVILPCSLSTKQNIVRELFDWKKDGQKEVFLYDAGLHYNNGRAGQDEQFKGRVSNFQDELKHGNASIIIRNTKVTDSGDYTCDFPRLQPRQTFHIELVVGVAPKPSVTILDQTKDWSLLQCEVHGASPKPKVEWQDSAGSVLHAEEPQVSERGGHFYITLNTTVTETDRFRCVATQQEINHKIYTEIYVHINDQKPTKEIVGVAVGVSVVWLMVGFAAVLARSGKCCNKGSAQDKRDQTAGKESEPLDSSTAP